MEDIIVGFVAVLAIIAVFVLFFALFTSLTAVVVAFAWNWCGAHTLFHADTLSFWQVIGVAVGINLIRSILSPRSNGVSVERS